MDWSLVLASQGIDHRLDHAEATGWTLTVSATDHERALAQIEQYRLENRHWRWRRPVFSPGIFFDWRCTAWVLLVIVFYGASERWDLRGPGMMTQAALMQGEWWRIFTAMWLHADPAHLAMNAVFGFLFLGLVMGNYGPGVGLLAASLAGAGGNVLSGAIHGPGLHGLGASGVVMGALGLLAFPPLILPRGRSAAVRLVGSGLLAGGLIFAMIGLNPTTDVIAHLGGFVTGWLLGWLLTGQSRYTRRPSVNLVAGLLSGSLILIPWILAWTRSN
jgi:rhomboid protease GluP